MTLMRSLAATLAVVVVAAACSGADTTDPSSTTVSGSSEPTSSVANDATTAPESAAIESFAGTVPAPEFPAGLDWLNTAGPLTLEQLRGKIVLLDFWTYGCINCIHIIPDLDRLESEYPDELVVIGVHSAKFVNESATENIRNVVLRYDVAHPIVNDRNFEIWRSWGAQAWPTTVLIDPAGNVVGGHAGEGVYDVVAPVIASLVQEFGESGELDTAPLELRPERDRAPARILTFPGKVHVVPGDERLFVADSGRNRIVVADRTTGDVLAVYGDGRAGFVDGAGLSAQFDAPQGMDLSADGKTLYVADTNNHAIRAIDLETGAVDTLLGTGELGWPPIGGVAPNVELNSPWDVLRDGTSLFIAMAGHHQIWAFDLEAEIALPLVGSGREGVLNGPLDQAELAQPSGLAIDEAGRLYFADSESSSIRYADVATPIGATGLVAGGDQNLFEFGDTDGVGNLARFQHPLGVVIWEGQLVVADTYNSRLRLVDPVTGQASTLLGAEQGWADGTDPRFYEPGGLTIDGDTLYVADTNNHSIRVVDLPSGNTDTLVLRGIEAFEPPPDDADYRGTIVTLQPITVAPGAGEVHLDVELPPGYKVNEDAPSSIELASDASAITIADASATTDLTGASLPVTIGVDFAPGAGELTADVVLVYCRDDAESLCLIEQLRFRVGVTVEDDAAGSTISLPFVVSSPS